jgi:signal transduction histidine kinase
VRLRVAECHELNAHSSLDLEAGGRSYSLMIASVPGAGYLNLYGRDTTEQRRAEDQLRQSQKLEAIGRLAGGVAHDFNNLLAVIIGYSDLMLPQMEPSGELRQHLQEIRSAADRAAGLTRQLLAFSRKQVLQPKVLDINAVVTGMIRMIRRLVREDIELSTELSPEAGCVRADPVQMEQILLNLAANAGDAMPRGGRLTIRTARAALDEAYARAHPDVLPGDYALISVTDTGQGMDPETQARIFEPFFTTKDQGKGTGLGLSIVYGTVKQSGGHIDLESAPGQGTTFRVYLPGVRAVSEAQPRAAPEAKATPRGSETILVAEDDPVLRSMVVRILRDTGYKVLEAANGEEAKAVCARHRGEVHLLLTDVIMPVMGGTTLADHLGRFFPGMRTMFMSGHTNVAIDRPFLQKPFGTGELLKKIRDVLDAPGTGPGGGRSP